MSVVMDVYYHFCQFFLKKGEFILSANKYVHICISFLRSTYGRKSHFYETRDISETCLWDFFFSEIFFLSPQGGIERKRKKRK